MHSDTPHRNCKRLKLGGGHLYDRPSVWATAVPSRDWKKPRIYRTYIAKLCQTNEMSILNVHTDELLHTETDKWQTRPLVREGAPQRQDSNFQKATLRQEVISCQRSQSGLDTSTYWLTDWPTDRPTDRPTISRKVTSTSAYASVLWNIGDVLVNSYNFCVGYLATLSVSRQHSIGCHDMGTRNSVNEVPLRRLPNGIPYRSFCTVAPRIVLDSIELVYLYTNPFDSIFNLCEPNL
jgi:hypothetical protein